MCVGARLALCVGGESISALRQELEAAREAAARQSDLKRKIGADLSVLLKQRTDLDAMRHLIVRVQNQQNARHSGTPAPPAGGAPFDASAAHSAWQNAQAVHPPKAYPNGGALDAPLPLATHNLALGGGDGPLAPATSSAAVPHAQLSFSHARALPTAQTQPQRARPLVAQAQAQTPAPNAASGPSGQTPSGGGAIHFSHPRSVVIAP